MVYAVPESKRSIKQNQFEFTVPGDRKKYTIPKAKYLTVGQIEMLSTKDTEVTLTDVLDLIGDGPAKEAARKLDQEQLANLMEAWQTDSGLDLGESSASS